VTSQKGPQPLDDIDQPLCLDSSQLGLVGEHIAVKHSLEVDLVVGSDYGQGSLHPEVDGPVELTLYKVALGLHARPYGSTPRHAHHVEVTEEVRHRLGHLPQLGPLLLHGPGRALQILLKTWKVDEGVKLRLRQRVEPEKQNKTSATHLLSGCSGPGLRTVHPLGT
jgi:hypothetical protein